jgi:hypothetical protein
VPLHGWVLLEPLLASVFGNTHRLTAENYVSSVSLSVGASETRWHLLYMKVNIASGLHTEPLSGKSLSSWPAFQGDLHPPNL